MKALRCVSCVLSLLCASLWMSCATDAAAKTATPASPRAGFVDVAAALPNARPDTSSTQLATPPALFAELVAQMADEQKAQALRVTSTAELPDALSDLDYDAYRSIRFRTERSLWRGEPSEFEVQFFHPGLYYKDLVDVFVVEGNERFPFPFSTQLFDYGPTPRPESGAGLGFTGLRLHAPIERADYRDEVIVFQGASYFRSLGRGQVYGLSARGLSVDMGDSKGEEFPRFNQLYLVRPGPSDHAMWVIATLTSARTKGVYAMRVQPADTTTVEVFARVWVTGEVRALDIAPLSSMYLFGEEAPASFGDFRPEVHDSDGMAFLSREGEWLFRPLRNPPRDTRTEHRLDSPRGFGLMQRDRNFASYQDLEARYQDRPSAWIEPIGDWGAGVLHLLELHTDRETNDNIALAWVPDRIPEEGLDLHYRVHFGHSVANVPPPSGVVAATRVAKTQAGARFLIDFAGTAISASPQVQAQIDVTGARLIEQHVEDNRWADSRRVSFEIVCDVPSRDVELRAFVRDAASGSVLSETWSYLWQSCP